MTEFVIENEMLPGFRKVPGNKVSEDDLLGSLNLVAPFPSQVNLQISACREASNLKIYMSFGSLRDFIFANIGGVYYFNFSDRQRKIEDMLRENKETTLEIPEDAPTFYSVLGITTDIYAYVQYGDLALYNPAIMGAGATIPEEGKLVLADPNKGILTQNQYEICGDLTEYVDLFWTDNPRKILCKYKTDRDPLNAFSKKRKEEY